MRVKFAPFKSASVFQSLFWWNVLLNSNQAMQVRRLFRYVSILVLVECTSELSYDESRLLTSWLVSILVLVECTSESHFMYIV